LTSRTVSGAFVTSMMPKPTTSPVFRGEEPKMNSPPEPSRANVMPAVVWADWVMTDQLMAYRPFSWNVMTPVAGLYRMLPAIKMTLSKTTALPGPTDPARVRSSCNAIWLIVSSLLKSSATF